MFSLFRVPSHWFLFEVAQQWTAPLAALAVARSWVALMCIAWAIPAGLYALDKRNAFRFLFGLTSIWGLSFGLSMLCTSVYLSLLFAFIADGVSTISVIIFLFGRKKMLRWNIARETLRVVAVESATQVREALPKINQQLLDLAAELERRGKG